MSKLGESVPQPARECDPNLGGPDSTGVSATAMPFVYGEKPKLNFTAEYSGWILPARVRMVSDGSVHVWPRNHSGKSSALIIPNNPISGGSPSRKITGRWRTMERPAAFAAACTRASCGCGSIWNTDAKKPPGVRCFAALDNCQRGPEAGGGCGKSPGD